MSAIVQVSEVIERMATEKSISVDQAKRILSSRERNLRRVVVLQEYVAWAMPKVYGSERNDVPEPALTAIKNSPWYGKPPFSAITPGMWLALANQELFSEFVARNPLRFKATLPEIMLLADKSRKALFNREDTSQ